MIGGDIITIKGRGWCEVAGKVRLKSEKLRQMLFVYVIFCGGGGAGVKICALWNILHSFYIKSRCE